VERGKGKNPKIAEGGKKTDRKDHLIAKNLLPEEGGEIIININLRSWDARHLNDWKGKDGVFRLCLKCQRGGVN